MCMRRVSSIQVWLPTIQLSCLFSLLNVTTSDNQSAALIQLNNKILQNRIYFINISRMLQMQMPAEVSLTRTMIDGLA